MLIESNIAELDVNSLKETIEWNNPLTKELGMHKIHLYPAKFPSFLISKSLEYADKNNIKINTIGDIFCGCGTTALEAKRNQKNFWGCDINPVATLIAKVKSEKYDCSELETHYNKIIERYEKLNYKTPKKILEKERIVYWFKLSQIDNLYKLLRIIKKEVPNGIYQDFFLVAFSNILKGASRWLTKSIKPTIDKNKEIRDVKKLFDKQFALMLKAVKETNGIVKSTTTTTTTIVNKNFLEVPVDKPFLDMLMTSPPYVTSYEYADLHQLSTLWLGFANDFRSLRKGTIGSVYHKSIKDEDIQKLNEVGLNIYEQLVKAKKSKAKSAAKYFIDMKNTVDKTYLMIKPGGLAIFVIGNTKHKGVYIDNAKFMIKCMTDKGFTNIDVYKRRISSKMLASYRDKTGKFSSDKRHREVYSYEFIVIGKKIS